MHVFQCLDIMCRTVYLGIFTQCQYIPFKHANRRRILQRPIKIQWDTRSAHLFSISSSSSVQDSFSYIEREFNDGDFNLRINVYTSCKECRPRPGDSITVQRLARVCTLCISPVPIYSQVRRYTLGARPWSSLNANSSFPHYFINL